MSRCDIGWLQLVHPLVITIAHDGARSTRMIEANGVTDLMHERVAQIIDVQIAVELLCDAVDDRFDAALLISADSDLAPPITAVRTRFPNKTIVVACPPERRSQKLQSVANGYFTLGRKVIQDSQFPNAVTKANGYVLSRPTKWT